MDPSLFFWLVVTDDDVHYGAGIIPGSARSCQLQSSYGTTSSRAFFSIFSRMNGMRNVEIMDC
jgi:hypothetical protein